VGDAVNPSTNRAALVESFKAAPQGDMDLLHQIAPCVWISFVRPRQSLEGGAISFGGLLIHLVLVGPLGRHGCNLARICNPAHIKVVARERNFLQQFFVLGLQSKDSWLGDLLRALRGGHENALKIDEKAFDANFWKSFLDQLRSTAQLPLMVERLFFGTAAECR
jgi:hypothetical protein